MKYLFTAFFLVITLHITAQNNENPLVTQDAEKQTRWVDSVYNSLSVNDKIAQLYMVQAFSNQDKATKKKLVDLVKNLKIGGIIYSKGGPVRQAQLDNELQALSNTPMLIGMDAEWGLSMRLDSTFSFPWNMTLGAVKNRKLIAHTGYQLGEHCKRLGVHFNFAPVVDINTNPKNPIIGNRSFGEDKYNVTDKALAFMEGMQAAGVLANAKHFPGHGDTDSDSHKTLPSVNFSAKRIDSVELYPYKKLIEKGLSSVMVAHLNIPSLESREGYPSSISKNIVTSILKERLKFKGLIFTDALNMKGAANFSAPGDIDLAAFLAGNDVMLISEDVSKGIAKIKEAIETGVTTEARLAHSVKKVLMAKYKVGLNNYKPIETKNLIADLNRLKDHILYEELLEEAITVVKNDHDLLPLKKLEERNIAYVNLGDDAFSPFLKTLKKYTKVTHVKAESLDDLLVKLNDYNTVVIGFHKSNASPWKAYKFTDKELVWLHEIARNNCVVLDVFAKPYSLIDIPSVTNIESIVMSYQNSDVSQSKSAQIIFGALGAKGALPVSIGDTFKVGEGVWYPSINRLGYSIPERVGLSSEKLKKIDELAKLAIAKKATPGIQLLIAKKGKVVYSKNFGYQTYKKKSKITDEVIYDMASVTKIIATLPLVMELEENGTLDLNSKLSTLLPKFENSNKSNITVKNMLSHYAKLRPWVPFYAYTLDSITKKPSKDFYRKSPSKTFSVKVADQLYMKPGYQKVMMDTIIQSPLLDDLRYRYSDLPYYILKDYIEDHYKSSLADLTQDHFYKSLGANYTTYNPLEKFNKSQIAPSEKDDYFRFQTIRGYVHDMGAAMQGGVGGHAGVFSNANDIAKIMQMYLQGGNYGGKRYVNTDTFDKFNTCYYCESDNRRGVALDKPQLGEHGPTCGCVSMDSFGHSGFTGTYTWADPEKDLVYVFIANRTFPTHKGRNVLLRENIRTNIQEAIYDAIED